MSNAELKMEENSVPFSGIEEQSK
jgi:hypothetical protein